MAPKETALLLRSFLNTNRLTLSDLRKAQIYLLNGRLGDGIGKGRGKDRSPVLGASRAVQTELEECTS